MGKFKNIAINGIYKAVITEGIISTTVEIDDTNCQTAAGLLDNVILSKY